MDPKSELKSLQEKGSKLVANVKAANRDLTDAEATELEAITDRIIELKAAVERGERNAETLARIADLTGVGEGAGGAKGFITPASLKASVASAAQSGIKALVAAGSTAIPVQLDTAPIPLGQVGFGLLSLVPTKRRSTPKYSYMRQVARVNNAAVVAPGAVKPVSTYTAQSFDNELEVVAHLSEYVDKFLLEDNDDLRAFLQSELINGVVLKATTNALAAIAGAEGIQSVAFSGSPADSILTAASSIAGVGHTPSLVVVNDQDYLAMRLSKDANEQYYGGNPFQGGATPNIWGYTTFVTPNQTEGEALVLAADAVGVSTDEAGVQVAWDAISGFDKNQVRARVEGRFSTDVFIPQAVAKVDLSAA